MVVFEIMLSVGSGKCLSNVHFFPDWGFFFFILLLEHFENAGVSASNKHH